ncbi:ABC transporter transmembrane region [Raoultella terrigena]|uniref:ABC transporter transmembrane region n=1 Tax=Raoultella terrigena TaxID=577 RepID=A0A3P8M463_RAOTE|nr:ABC transporter transmembrane region [Raoultella terrigena]
MISRTNSDLQQMHNLLQMCPVPLAVFTYYVAGIAVMLWMSPAMTLIVVGVLACLAVTALRARRRVFAQTGLASDRLAHLTEHMREVLTQISVVKSCVAELRETRWLDRQSRQMVRVRIGAAISQAIPGGDHAGAAGAGANCAALFRRLVGDERPNRPRDVRCFRQLPGDAHRADPRAGFVSGHRPAHPGVGRARFSL